MHALYPGRDKVDALALQIGAHRDLNVFSYTPFHGHPRIGRRKLESLAVRDNRHLVALANLFLHFVSCRHAADPRAHDYNVCHDVLPVWFGLVWFIYRIATFILRLHIDMTTRKKIE